MTSASTYLDPTFLHDHYCLHNHLLNMVYPLFFFTVRHRPPISTLFPYTTLFRSQIGGANVASRNVGERQFPCLERGDVEGERSEEHTSELQSRGHLVCRLLLEKKKKAFPLRISRETLSISPMPDAT